MDIGLLQLAALYSADVISGPLERQETHVHESYTSLFQRFHEEQKEKKRKFANTLNYKKLCGETYGYDLKDPYTEDEICMFETRAECPLPSDFRYYLINHASELFTRYYPRRLGGFTSEYIIQHYLGRNSKIPLDCTEMESGEDGWVDGKGWVKNWDECVTDDVEDYDITEECCMYPIAFGGCMYETYIVIKGNQAGTIWDTSNGDTYRKTCETFTEYVREYMSSR